MKLETYLGKRFTLVLTDDQDDSVAYGGWIASQVGETLHLERSGGQITLEIEWLERIRAIDNEEARRILPDTDFWLPLSVGLNPQEDGTDLATGMKWPS